MKLRTVYKRRSLIQKEVRSKLKGWKTYINRKHEKATAHIQITNKADMEQEVLTDTMTC